jgi:hypothetical protein
MHTQITHINEKMRRKLSSMKTRLPTYGQQGATLSKNKILHLQHEHKT